MSPVTVLVLQTEVIDQAYMGHGDLEGELRFPRDFSNAHVLARHPSLPASNAYALPSKYTNSISLLLPSSHAVIHIPFLTSFAALLLLPHLMTSETPPSFPPASWGSLSHASHPVVHPYLSACRCESARAGGCGNTVATTAPSLATAQPHSGTPSGTFPSHHTH